MKKIETRWFQMSGASPNLVALRQAVLVLRQGGLVAFPTETVYGLGADGLNEAAVQRIFEAKGRPAHDPIILHIGKTADLSSLVASIPPLAQKLIEAFWPGSLTLVLPKADVVPSVVTAGGATVAIRCPAHPLAQALIRAAETPIAAPSANRFSHTSPTTAQHVWDDLQGRIDLILDGGPARMGVESTVVDVTGEVAEVLRPGGVTLEMLTAVLGEVRLVQKAASAAPKTPALLSPGMLTRHYAPNTPLWLIVGDDETALRNKLVEVAKREAKNGRLVGLMLPNEDIPFVKSEMGDGPIIRQLGSIHNLPQIAASLYDALRDVDRRGTALILARDLPPIGIGLAIRDRLRRAAERQIFTH